METILTIAAMPVTAAAVIAAAYEAALLAGHENTVGRWLRHLIVQPQSSGRLLPALRLIAVMLVYAALAMALSPLVITAEALVLARRHHRGEVIRPAPWPRAIGQAHGQPQTP